MAMGRIVRRRGLAASDSSGGEAVPTREPSPGAG